MCHLRSWFSAGLGSAMLMAGLDVLIDLFLSKEMYDSKWY